MSIILTAMERNVYENIIAIEPLSKICDVKKEFWLGQVKITIELLNEIKDTQGQQILFSLREIIGITIISISYFEKEFLKELEKLKYKDRVSDKTTYDQLKDLKIHISGIGDLDLMKKGLFIILAKLSEDDIFAS